MNAKLVYKYNKKKDSFFYLNEQYFINNFKSYKDQIYQVYEIKEYFMILFFSKIEIDGLFLCTEPFKLDEYKAEEIVPINCEINNYKIIQNNQYLIYEVKSGNNLESLLQQVKKHYYFISKYFAVYSKYNIGNFIYLGFIRDENKLNISNVEKLIFRDFKIPIIIIRFFKTIFEKDIFFENVEISDIAELKFLTEKNNSEIRDLKDEIKDLKDEFKNELISTKNDIVQEIKEMLNNALKNLNLTFNNSPNNNKTNSSFPQSNSQNNRENNNSPLKSIFQSQISPSKEESKNNYAKKKPKTKDE